MTNMSYTPDEVSPPGESLSDLIEELGMTQRELSQRLGRSAKHLNQVISGKAPITVDLALALELVLGTPAKFWILREANYREWKARTADAYVSQSDLEWSRKFDYRGMVRNDWIPQASDQASKLRNLLRFFAVASPAAYTDWSARHEPEYRRAHLSMDKDHLVMAWLRQGEILAEVRELPDYSEDRFRAAIHEVRQLCGSPIRDNLHRIVEIFAESGVALLFVRELPGMGVSGATRWLTPSKAVIQLTLRYRTSDFLWFTLFHETCHVLKHKRRQVFLESGTSSTAEEAEADRFAATTLIPQDRLREFAQVGDFTRSSILQFADSINVSPGIIVGRLQHEKRIPHASPLNELKEKLDWDSLKVG